MRGALLLLVIAVAACNQMPLYRGPQMSLPKEFKASGAWQIAKPSDTASKSPWWTALHDARLSDLIRRAGNSNASLEVALHRMEEAQALARAESANLLPFANVLASSRRARGSGAVAVNFAGGRTVTRNRGTLEAGYEFDLWGKLRSGKAAAQAEAEAARADYEHALLSMQAAIATTYFALQAQDEAIALLKRTVALRERALQMAQARFKQGDSAQMDVALAETELNATKSEAIGLEKRRAELHHALALLLGTTPGDVSLPTLTMSKDLPSVPRAVPSRLLERRPDIAAAERRMASLNAEIGIAKAALFPSITLGMSGGSESSLTSRLLASAARVWGLGPELQWEALSMGRNKAKIDAAKARYEASAAQYRETVLKAVREVEDALSAVDVLRRQRAAQQQTVDAAQRSVDLAMKRYEAGLVAYYEVLDAQRTLLRAEQEATVIQGEFNVNTVLLARALGGGWSG